MKFEITFFETGVGATISNDVARFKEIWLSDSLKAAMAVWAELGWEDSKRVKIEDGDWRSPSENGTKSQVIGKILCLNRISRQKDFNIDTYFEEGDNLLLEIVALIKNNSFCFDPIEEVTQFRRVMTLYLATGIRNGLASSGEDAPERFVHAIYETLNTSPIEHPIEAEVFFNRFQSDTIVSATGIGNFELDLNCECITVEIEA